MSTETEARKIPAPLYAAAGAGDLAYQQLRKLPEQIAVLQQRVVELRPVVTDAVSEKALKADADKLRDAARRNAAVLLTQAQVVQERAVKVYTELVARGERVVAAARSEEAKVQLRTALEETRAAEKAEAALAEEKTEVVDAQAELPPVADKGAKRTRPAVRK